MNKTPLMRSFWGGIFLLVEYWAIECSKIGTGKWIMLSSCYSMWFMIPNLKTLQSKCLSFLLRAYSCEILNW